MKNAAETSPANESVLTPERAVALLKEGGFLNEGNEAGATALLNQHLETMQAATRKDLEPAAHVEDGVKPLSPENREFLDKLIKPQIVDFIRNLKGIGIEFKTDVDKLIAVLENLGDLTLDEVRTHFEQPEITLDLGGKLGKLKLLINRHFNPDNNKADVVYCKDPNDPVCLDDGNGDAGVFIVEGPDNMSADQNITGKKGNWGGERDAYIDELVAEQNKGIKVDHLLARQYLPWAAMNKFAKKRPVDGNTYTLLRGKKGDPVVPVGDTTYGKVFLSQLATDLQFPDLRRRRAVGGYVKGE